MGPRLPIDLTERRLVEQQDDEHGGYHALMRTVRSCLASILLLSLSLRPLAADPIPVRHAEGPDHGSLTLSTLDGKHLANGDLSRTSEGDEITARMVLHFDDGSLYDETTVFTQREQFRFLRNHVLRKGPAFPIPLEAWIDGMTGAVKVSYVDGGKTKTVEQTMELPADLANGFITTLVKNVSPGAPPTLVSLVALTPKPRLVHLEIQSTGKEGDATRYLVKVRIGGFSGGMAKILGKQPPDSSVWISADEPPTFVKSESPLYVGGDLWRIERRPTG